MPTPHGAHTGEVRGARCERDLQSGSIVRLQRPLFNRTGTENRMHDARLRCALRSREILLRAGSCVCLERPVSPVVRLRGSRAPSSASVDYRISGPALWRPVCGRVARRVVLVSDLCVSSRAYSISNQYVPRAGVAALRAVPVRGAGGHPPGGARRHHRPGIRYSATGIYRTTHVTPGRGSTADRLQLTRIGCSTVPGSCLKQHFRPQTVRLWRSVCHAHALTRCL